MACCIIISTAISSLAQNKSAAEKVYQKALTALENQDYTLTIKLLNQSIQNDTTYIDPIITLFQIDIDFKKYSEAIHLFEKAHTLDTTISLPYFLKQATAYASLGDYSKAKTIVNTFIHSGRVDPALKSKATDFLKVCDFAIAHPTSNEIQINNLGDSVNTAAAEYFPYFSAKDSLLVFMRKKNIRREDFFTSHLTSHGFSNATLLADSINDADKKGSVSFSPDLQTLYFAADYPEQGYGRYDIYKSIKKNEKWSAPKNLGKNVNTDYWDSAPSIAPDGKALYFSSNRPGGFGGIDLYVCYKNEKGYWEEAENLGDKINTPGDEQTPFMHADNKSLYFSSTGWPGFGGADFYVSRKKYDDSWTTPLNLGYPINTFDNEGSIAVSSNGTDAYIASDRSDTRGGLDIYKATLSSATRANKKYYLKGIVLDATSKKTITALVNLTDPIDHSSFVQLKIDTAGQFIVELPYIDSIRISITSPFHDSTSITLTSNRYITDQIATEYFYLPPITSNFSKTFTNVLFITNSDQLMDGSEIELDELTRFLLSTTTATVLIEGHTDNRGNAVSNKLLSLKRAKAIATYLAKKGVAPKRVTTIGYGDTKPIAPNTTEQGRQRNRRTSFTITLPK